MHLQGVLIQQLKHPIHFSMVPSLDIILISLLILGKSVFNSFCVKS